jgi:hypothetical protein
MIRIALGGLYPDIDYLALNPGLPLSLMRANASASICLRRQSPMRASDDSVVGDADRVAKIQVGNISEVDADKWFVSNDPRVMPRGVDIAYGEDRKLVFAVAVVVDWKTLRVKESVSVKSAIRFPYPWFAFVSGDPRNRKRLKTVNFRAGPACLRRAWHRAPAHGLKDRRTPSTESRSTRLAITKSIT